MSYKVEEDRALKICFLSYRSNPYCGGQGVYVKNLTNAIKRLGHEIEVISGPPDLILDHDIPVHKISSLDLYNPNNLFRKPTLKELSEPLNLLEWLSVSTMGFPEPFIFGLKAKSFLKNCINKYDIVHDNQSLSYGLLGINKQIPTLATIHHPITKDRDIAIDTTDSFWMKLKYLRWYSFIGMQKRVSKQLPKIITVSKCSKKDISEKFNISPEKITIIPNGIDTNLFRPLKNVQRQPGRIIVTNSSDTPLKGLPYLLKAVKKLSNNHNNLRLFIVGTPQIGGNLLKLIGELDIKHLVNFTGRISNNELILQYAKAFVAVIPSIYEGFGLPAGEAMACGVPVVSTTGGALPEVIANAGILVPPKNYILLSKAIDEVLSNPKLAANMSKAGFIRIKKNFTWIKAAKKTIKTYKEIIN